MKHIPSVRHVIAGIATLLVATSAAWAEKPPQTWDGLELTKRKGLDLVYIRPNVQFKAYKNVQIDTLQVAFDKNWDPNENVRSLSRHMTAEDIEKIRSDMVTEFRQVFVDELTKAGYQVVDKAGDDTLRVSPALADVYINAPDRMEPGRVTTYTTDAGRMTIFMELRDGLTEQLLARVVDKREATNTGFAQVTNSVTNSAEFRRMVRSWAQRLVKGLDKVNGKED